MGPTLTITPPARKVTMKFAMKSATATLPDGSTVEYTTAQMLEHIARNGREFGRSGDADKVAQAIRIIDAVRSNEGGFTSDLSAADGEAVKAAVKKPSCGWSAVPYEREVVISMNQDGSANKKKAQRIIALSAVEIYDLIAGVLNG